MIIVDSDTMAAIDKKARDNFAYPGILLMENAGLNSLRILEEKTLSHYENKNTVFVCGSGNNGGDALVMARHHFIRGNKGSIITTGSAYKEGHAKINFELCRNLGIKILDWKKKKKESLEELKKSLVIVDGIAGTGLKGPLREREAELCDEINSTGSFICSIDIPSGIGDNFKNSFKSVNADLTITIGLPKTSLYYPSARKRCGRIIITDAAFPPSVLSIENPSCILIEKDMANRYISLPPHWSYKNSRGHAAVFAGSRGKSGAGVLSSRAALKSLAGLVTLYTDKEIYSSLISSVTSVMLDSFPPEKPFKELLKTHDAFIAGPGWGFEKEKRALLEKLLLETDKPLVIDADGISLLSSLKDQFNNKNCIITPHPGEFATLVKVPVDDIMDNPAPYLKSFCIKTGITVVLKSHVTWICTPGGKIMILDSMNPALATAGSGDILAGIIGGLLAYGLHPEKAAVSGVIIHSEAGKKCYNEKGYFASEELLDFISLVIKEIKQA